MTNEFPELPFVDSLPPRPDPQTGEPFPPPGLSYFGGGDTKPEDNPYRETRLSHKPKPPPGLGPVLVWHRESRKSKIVGVVGGAAILIVGITIISLIKGYGLDWFGAWQIWLIIAGGTILAAGPFSYLTYSAGADWLQVDLVRWGKHQRRWVDLYELTKINASYGGTTFHLDLTDKDITLSRSFQELQQDHRIWDLVYNGILHSVANGATVTHQALAVLKLDQTPALRLRDQRHEGPR